jgi:hypothetical protein
MMIYRIDPINGKDGTTAITGVNVLANDKLNGVILTPAGVVTNLLKQGPLTVNTDGTVSVDPNNSWPNIHCTIHDL